MSVPPELQAIRRLPENMECADCGAHSSFGHGNVVVKFRSFVCGDCKSAHQAYSHRVKVCVCVCVCGGAGRVREEEGERGACVTLPPG